MAAASYTALSIFLSPAPRMTIFVPIVHHMVTTSREIHAHGWEPKKFIWFILKNLKIPLMNPVSTSRTRFHIRMTEEIENTVGMKSNARKNL